MALLSSCRCVSCTRRHGDIFASEGPRRPFPAPDRRGRQLPRHLLAAPRYVRAASARTRCACTMLVSRPPAQPLALRMAAAAVAHPCVCHPCLTQPAHRPCAGFYAIAPPTRTANIRHRVGRWWAPGSRVGPWRQALSAVAAPGVGCEQAGGGPQSHRGQPRRHGRVRGAVMVARMHRERTRLQSKNRCEYGALGRCKPHFERFFSVKYVCMTS